MAWIKAAIVINAAHRVSSQWRDYQLKSCTRAFIVNRRPESFLAPHGEFAILGLRIELPGISVGEVHNWDAANAILEEP